MNSRQLYIQKEGEWFKPVGAWACSKCGLTFQTKEQADKCCNWYCEDCGASTKDYWTRCDNCRKDEWARLDKEKLEKAKKIPYKDWGGPVFDRNGDFYWDSDELLAYYEDEGEAPPTYCFPGKKVEPRYQADRIVESISENAYEGFGVDDALVMELQDFLDLWCAKLETWYEWDWSEVVLLNG